VVQGILTPGAGTIMAHLNSSLHNVFADKVAPRVVMWLKFYWSWAPKTGAHREDCTLISKCYLFKLKTVGMKSAFSTKSITPWANTTGAHDLITFLEQSYKANRSPSQFHVVQGILTPGAGTIMLIVRTAL
jgi:hypothetical protein